MWDGKINKARCSIFCKDKHEKFVGDSEEHLNRWAGNFQEMYKAEEEEEVILPMEETNSLTTEVSQRREEIAVIIRLFKNNKSPVENGLTPEIWKARRTYSCDSLAWRINAKGRERILVYSIHKKW